MGLEDSPAEAPQDSPEQDFLSELTTDSDSAADAEGEPSSEGQEPGAGGAGGSRQEPGQQAAPTAQGPRKYKVRGREYTVQELEERGLLDDLVQTHEQHPHLTRKYQELLETNQGGRGAQPGQPSPAQPGQAAAPSPAQVQSYLRSRYGPELDHLTRNGHFEKEFGDWFPNVAANMLFVGEQVADMRQRLLSMDAERSVSGREQVRNYVAGTINGHLDNLAGQGDEDFAPLADPAVRQQFLGHLMRLNPSSEQAINPEFLQREWLAFNYDTVIKALRASRQQSKAKNAAALAGARGGSGGSRPAAANTEGKPWDSVLEDD